MSIKTAVVTAAGTATRMWPGSKVFPKELFPLGRIPVIVYLVWEFLEVGAERIVFVVGPRSEGPLRAVLDATQRPPPKVAAWPEVARFHDMLSQVEFRFVRQEGPYGNGTPLLNALDLLEGEPCIYAFGDDIVFGENPSAGLLEVFERTGCPVVATQLVSDEQVRSFGIAEYKERDGLRRVVNFVEKPHPSETTSRLAALGRYLVTPQLADRLRTTAVGRDDELWLADALTTHVQQGLQEESAGKTATSKLYAYTLQAGRWYTVGNPQGYAEAVMAAVAEQT